MHSISRSTQNKDFHSTTCIASHFVRPRLRLLLSALHFQYNVKHTRVQDINIIPSICIENVHLVFLIFRNQTKSCYSIPLFMTYSDQVHNISCSIQNKDFHSTTCIASHFVRPRLRLLLSTLHFQYNVKHTRVQVLNAKCFRALLRIILWFSKHCNDFA